MDTMDSEDTMQAETGADMNKPGPGQDEESPSVFLPKEITMGKTFKAGDEIVLKIEDVDPETGELECKYATDGQESEGGDTMESSFDKAMPPEQEGY